MLAIEELAWLDVPRLASATRLRQHFVQFAGMPCSQARSAGATLLRPVNGSHSATDCRPSVSRNSTTNLHHAALSYTLSTTQAFLEPSNPRVTCTDKQSISASRGTAHCSSKPSKHTSSDCKSYEQVLCTTDHLCQHCCTHAAGSSCSAHCTLET